MGEKRKGLVFRAIGNGTVYFLKNVHLVLLAFIPMIALNLVFMLGDQSKMAAGMAMGKFPPWFFIFILFNMLYTMWVFNFLAIHIASKPYILDLNIKNQALVALKRLPGTFLVGVMYGVSVMFCFLLLIIPAIIVGCLWSMAPFVYVFYGGIIKSFKEGREIIKGRFWSIFLLLFISVIIAFILLITAYYFTGFAGYNIINQLLYFAISIIVSISYFWMLALYKGIKEEKDFKHDEDRKGKSGFYKTILVLTSIVFVAFASFYGYMFTVMIPNMALKTGMETKIEGNKTTTYIKGVPQTSIEQKSRGVVTYTYYYKNGSIKTEMSMKFFSITGQTKEYYENGKIKSVKTYDKGKLNGESLEYDENGQLSKKCEYKDNNIVNCEEIKAKTIRKL